MRNHDIKVGDWVAFTDADAHKWMPQYYPQAGTVGQVTQEWSNGTVSVQWPAGSTSGDDMCFAAPDDLVPAPAPKDVQKLRLMAAVCCLASLVMVVQVFRFIFCKEWVEAVCCAVVVVTAMLKAMELDRKAQNVPAPAGGPETEADDAEV